MNYKINNPKAETLEDIVFENRNKSYGAYSLNKKQVKFLFYAFLISVFCFTSAFTVPLVMGDRDAVQKPVDEGKAILTVIDEDLIHQNDFKLPELPPEKITDQNFYSPEVVEEVTDTNLSFGSTLELLKNTTNTPVTEPDELVPDIDPIPVIPENTEEAVVIAEEPATFRKGGLEEFRDWVMDNIRYPKIAQENEISGRIFVQFCVDKNGNVVDIKVTRGLDASINEEIVRVLQSSPKWNPAKQAGSKVKQLFSMSVLFQLEKR